MELTEVGLEWIDSKGHARRMPFACMRLICLAGDSKAMRISGPPGYVWLRDGQMKHAQKILQEVTRIESCKTSVRHNSFYPIHGLGAVWARIGRRLDDSQLPDLNAIIRRFD